ncbi:MAG: cytochrome P450 [Gammaproteobacteria bacterium]|nr:cytochrome P450 [Gammaproteobacteria bacterium]
MSETALAPESNLEGFSLECPPPGFVRDPFPWYAALRERRPVHRLGDGSWLLTRHADCVAVYQGGTFSSDKHDFFRPKFGDSPLYEHHTTSLVFNDPPYHTRVRETLVNALKPKNIQPAVAALEHFVTERIASLRERREFDAIEHFAAAVPVEIICILLSVPASERAHLRRWSLAILGALEPAISPEQARIGNEAVGEFMAYLRELIAYRRRRPAPERYNVLRSLVRQADGGDLSEAELLHNCIFLLNAGHETTTNLIGNGIHMLAVNGEARRRLRERPASIRQAVEEILRYQSPVQLGNRQVTAPVTIGGRHFRPGDQITLCIGAANRDPRAFADPETLYIDRTPNRHLAFAGGIHQCAGMSLARIEGRIALGAFFAAFGAPEIRIDPDYHPRLRFRGLKALEMRV